MPAALPMLTAALGVSRPPLVSVSPWPALNATVAAALMRSELIVVLFRLAVGLAARVMLSAATGARIESSE